MLMKSLSLLFSFSCMELIHLTTEADNAEVYKDNLTKLTVGKLPHTNIIAFKCIHILTIKSGFKINCLLYPTPPVGQEYIRLDIDPIDSVSCSESI